MWAAVAGAAGWVGSQAWTVAKDAIYRFWIKRGITVELSQLYEDLRRLEFIYERALQLATIGAVEPSVPLPLSNHIFASHYAHAVFAFNPVQRMAIQMIHAYIAELNSGAAELKALQHELLAKQIREGRTEGKDIDLVGGRVKGLFTTVLLTQWHIRHYLDHPVLPEMDFLGPTHSEYLSYLDGIHERIVRIEKAAEGMSLEDFTKPHDPEAFSKTKRAPESPSGTLHVT